MLVALALSTHTVCARGQNAELVLAGGSLALCSSYSPGQCRPDAIPPGRSGTRYALSAENIARAASLPASAADEQTPGIAEALQRLAKELGDGELDARRIEDALDRDCQQQRCRWSRLDDNQRLGVLTALQQTQLDARGERLRERVSLQASAQGGGVRVIEQFVAAARERAGGVVPRIAFVTASGFDPFDAVDYYTSLFTDAGASPIWWPLDAALAPTLATKADCAGLAETQRQALDLPDRSAVFPDLVAEQQAWCRSAHALGLPPGIHGVFFAGGDQWRLRRAFFDEQDLPYPWLGALREAVANGSVVVGGTSAGTAVQSGPGMLSNGSPEKALRSGPQQAAPPTPGCSRSGGCRGLEEDSFTLWPGGGFGLAGPFLMDTHFSERTREWRLLRALAEGPSDVGIGVDETSAVHLRQDARGWTLRALGASGAWLFEAGERRCGQLVGKAHYLAPGLSLHWSTEQGLVAPTVSGANERESATMPALALNPAGAGRPFARGVIREAASALALGLPTWSIKASGSSLRFSRQEHSRAWTGEGAYPGVVGLRFEFSYPAACKD